MWWLAIGVFYIPMILFSVWWIGADATPSTWGLGLGLLVGAGVAGLTQAVGDRWPFAGMERGLESMIGPLSGATVVALALASSIGEELVFRGVLQPWLGLWPATVAFALVHIPHERALWPWPFFAFGIGALFGGLTLWSGDLGGAMGAHFAVNLVNLNRLVGPGSRA